MPWSNHKKVRVYTDAVNGQRLKEDVNIRAISFIASNKFISSRERLIADVSVKAAMPSAADKDSKKRGLESSSSLVNVLGMVYDPNGKSGPGKIFKPYVTETERILAMSSADPNPNWGWLDRNFPQNSSPNRPNVRAVIKEYDADPKTGKPIHSTEVEIKGLGKTIRELNPRGTLAARAASAFGVIVDSLGKFRCPPGTPAANRFTNERGEGCFSIGSAVIENVIDIATNIAQSGPSDRATLVSSLISAGVTVDSIRKAYKKDGINGLMSLVNQLRLDLVGDWYTDASYRSSALAKVSQITQMTQNAEQRMRNVKSSRKKYIDQLMRDYGIDRRDDGLDLVELIERMSRDGIIGNGNVDRNSFLMGGSIESHQRSLLSTAVESGQFNLSPEDIDKYYEEKQKGTTSQLTEYIDAILDRERKNSIGNMEAIIHMSQKYPDIAKRLEISTKSGDEGVFDPTFHAVSGWEGSGYYIDFNIDTALKGLPPLPGPGKTHLVTADGASTQEEEWKAISSELSHSERMRTWVHSHMTDLAASLGDGWEDFGFEVGVHEFTHLIQFEKLKPLVEKYSGQKFEDLTNAEINYMFDALINEPTKLFSPGEESRQIIDDISAALGVSLDELIERRLDALAGSYSQMEQQNALRQIERSAADPANADQFNKMLKSLTVAQLETLAELGAAREMGIISGDGLDEALSFMDPPASRSIGVDVTPDDPNIINIPGSDRSPARPPILPRRPESSPEPSFTDSPRSRPRRFIDIETGEIVSAEDIANEILTPSEIADLQATTITQEQKGELESRVDSDPDQQKFGVGIGPLLTPTNNESLLDSIFGKGNYYLGGLSSVNRSMRSSVEMMEARESVGLDRSISRIEKSIRRIAEMLGIIDLSPIPSSIWISLPIDGSLINKNEVEFSSIQKVPITSEPVLDKSLNTDLNFKAASSRKINSSIRIPAGGVGTIIGENGNEDSVIIPPGKIKINNKSDDGSFVGEFVYQLSSNDYLNSMKNAVIELAKSYSGSGNQNRAEQIANNIAKMFRDSAISNSQNSKNGIKANKTLEKSEEVVSELERNGIRPFISSGGPSGENVYDYNSYSDAVMSGIKKLRQDSEDSLPEDYIDAELVSILSSNTDEQISELIRKIAVKVHNGFDIRARIPMSRQQLNYFAKNKSIKQEKLPKSVEQLKKQRDIYIGIGNEYVSTESITCSLMHRSRIRKIEENLFIKGTKVGSEEFFDSGRGIEIVLRSENSPRIGYGKRQNGTLPSRYVSLTSTDEQDIEMAIFGDISRDPSDSSKKIAWILKSASSEQYENFIYDDSGDIFSAIIIGDVSISDVEHVKIPTQILGISTKPFPENHPIVGRKSIAQRMKQRGVPEEKIKAFFEKGGNIGNNKNSIFANYLLEHPVASNMKIALIDSGFEDVIFTNQNGIDMLDDEAWADIDLRGKSNGIDAIEKLTNFEIEKIIDSYYKSPSKSKQPVGA